MNLLDLIHRQPIPAPWSEGEKIPWDDPDFSHRMLKEHLSQDHDAASRRFERIDRHVAWIHEQVLSGRRARVLDLGCGPGFYTSRLAHLGHTCVGIDFSPASIAYAAEQAGVENLSCRYELQDIRSANFGSGYDLVLLIFGELNVFRPQDACRILEKACRALSDGGLLLLEVSTFDSVQRLGDAKRSWSTAKSGLFSGLPYLSLYEGFWDAGKAAATERYFIVDAQSGVVAQHSATTQAYTGDQYLRLLEASGFERVRVYPSLTGEPDESQSDFKVLLAQKRSRIEPTPSGGGNHG